MSRACCRSLEVALPAARWGAVALFATACIAADARAQAPVRGADAPDDTRERSVGDAADALPGYVRTRVAGERPRGFAVNAGMGYGFTESLPGAPGPHHRLPFSLAVSGQPWRFLALGVRLEGRGDLHPHDRLGKDRGYVGQGALDVRAAGFVVSCLALGAHVSMLVFGDDDGVDPGATSVEATGLASCRHGGLSLALEGGFRRDRSAETARANAVHRPGDRLALGISDFDAVLLRAGAGYRWRALEGVGEIRWDRLVGPDAPKSAVSPLHVAAAGRYHATAALQLELAVDVTASSRPPVTGGAPFVVVDPRVVLRAGLSYRFGRARSAATPREAAIVVDEPVDGAPEPPPPPAEPRRTLEGAVRDERGVPIVDARVVVRVGDVTVETYTDEDGHFRSEGLPPGAASVDVTATQHRPLHLELGAESLELPESALTLRSADPVGVLRGLVRDFDGHPVRATIRVTPGATTAETGDDGSFEAELRPGAYTVAVEAEGFRTQSRTVTLSDGQVTIYNVDLREAR